MRLLSNILLPVAVAALVLGGWEWAVAHWQVPLDWVQHLSVRRGRALRVLVLSAQVQPLALALMLMR